MVKNRKKAFLGALIGLVGGLAGAGMSAGISAGNQRKQQEEAQRQEIKKAAYERAAALENSLNANAIDKYFNDKITFKNGGRINYDRLKQHKLYRCGGKRKKSFGGQFLNSNIGTALVGSIGQIGQGLISGLATKQQSIKPSSGFNFLPKTEITPNSYDIIINRNNFYKSQMLKFGGKFKQKCK